MNLSYPIAISAVLLLLAIAPAGAEPVPYPAPAPAKDQSAFGTGIQRTMTLLATSTPRKRNRVKILFYGQSITGQPWWKEVAEDLRRRFPDADLTIENRAIGGFSSQYLVKSAESDLYPFYPDLVIFHDYGSHVEYEKIIESLRRRTTAEILIQNDHVTKNEEMTEEEDPAKLAPNRWSAWMNHVFLPQTARKYGAELLDQRREWKEYLRANSLEPKALLSDSVHLNAQGMYLMAELVKPHLRYLPGHPTTAWKDMVRDYAVGKDVQWRNGRLTLTFEGNRVDLLAAPGAAGTAKILIDGKKPSEHPSLYTFTRASGYPGVGWPGTMRVASEKPLLVEDWTIRIKDATDDLKQFAFEVTGSKTGPDGEGRSDRRFVSNSGRVVIEPSDWSLARSREYTKNPLPADYTVKVKVVPLFVDEYAPAAVTDPTREYPTTIALGLPNEKHTLEIIADEGAMPSLAAIRVYRPPLR